MLYIIYYITCLCYISYIISSDTAAPLNIADLTPPKEKVLPIPEGSAFFCFSKTNPWVWSPGHDPCPQVTTPGSLGHDPWTLRSRPLDPRSPPLCPSSPPQVTTSGRLVTPWTLGHDPWILGHDLWAPGHTLDPRSRSLDPRLPSVNS